MIVVADIEPLEGALSASQDAGRGSEQERKAHSGIGRKALANLAGFAAFLKAFATFKGWTREAKSYGTLEAIAKKRSSLEAQIAALGEKPADGESEPGCFYFLGPFVTEITQRCRVAECAGHRFFLPSMAAMRSPNCTPSWEPSV